MLPPCPFPQPALTAIFTRTIVTDYFTAARARGASGLSPLPARLVI